MPSDMVLPTAAPASDPSESYRLDVGCASIAAAAVARAKVNSPASDKDKADAEAVLATTQRRARDSGRRLGKTDEQIDQAITTGTDGILTKLERSPGSADAAKEEADLGRVLLECTIVQTTK